MAKANPKAKVTKAKAKAAPAKVKVAAKAKAKAKAAPATAPKRAASAARPAKAPAAGPPRARRQDAVAPVRPVRAPSLPPPPPRPVLPLAAPPAPRVVPAGPGGELTPARDVGRLLRYGEQFGPARIELRHLATPLVITSGRIVLGDPAAPTGGKRSRTLARAVAPGKYRVMQSLANTGGVIRWAALVVHVGRPPIARWVVAHFDGQKPPRTAEDAPVIELAGHTLALMDAATAEQVRAGVVQISAADLGPADGSQVAVGTVDRLVDSSSGRNLLCATARPGPYHVYWALDAADAPVCLVIDYDGFKAGDWKLPKKK